MSQNFTPLSSQLGISGTSYRLQVGKVGNSWAARILKGNDCVASTTFGELNGNLIVGFVIKETAIPNLNPYQIMKTVQFLTKEAQGNELRAKTAGIPAPGPEVQARAQAAATAIASTPAPSPATAPSNADLASDEDTRASYRIIPKAREEVVVEQAAADASDVSWGATVTIAKDRQLKPIPTAEGSAGAASAAPQAAAKAPAPAASPVAARASAPAPVTAATTTQKPGIEERISKIETSIARIEARLAKIEEKLA
ncbi:MAG: hypothetical protein JW839_03905 [Candidatus Lokiarchaeota archaeon]|nr:hypothetical protein [Candidatus Lokiarchaeota archaeon]